MKKRWKLKTNSSNILLVLITLILVTTEWAGGQFLEAEDPGNSIEGPGGPSDPVQFYVGNDEISRFFFRPSAANHSRVLEDVNRCLDNFQFITCIKMLLLDRLNSLVSLLEDPSVGQTDFRLMGGLVVFERKNDPEKRADDEQSDSLSLDEEISVKVLRMFRNRRLRLNLLPNVKIEIEPTSAKTKDGFVCFSYKILTEEKSSKDDDDKSEQGRKKRKRGKGGMSMMMMLPQLLMLGFMPFTLASLKAMVMNAVMINMMALNGAIFMTIRNLVFGPRSGDNVKYVNYGYSKDRQTQSRRPVLIIHSPAAFVKQPKFHGKRKSTYSGLGYFPTGYLAPHNRRDAVRGNELGFKGYGYDERKEGWDFQDQNQKHIQPHQPHQIHKVTHAGSHRVPPEPDFEHSHDSMLSHRKLHRQHQSPQATQQQQQPLLPQPPPQLQLQQQQQFQKQQQQQPQEQQQFSEKNQKQWQRQQQQQQQQQQLEENIKNSKNQNSSQVYSNKTSRYVVLEPKVSFLRTDEKLRQQRRTQDSSKEIKPGYRWDPNPFQLETSSRSKSEKYSP